MTEDSTPLCPPKQAWGEIRMKKGSLLRRSLLSLCDMLIELHCREFIAEAQRERAAKNRAIEQCRVGADAA
jgi:hypothetical protein